MLIDFREDHNVAIEQIAPSYPDEIPFHPSEAYPEYSQGKLACQENQVYRGVRELFHQLGFDSKNFNTPTWNPLGEIITPGDTVLLKPNLVLHFNPLGYNTDSLITHASVIRAVADYALLALKNTGKLIIGDAPLQSCNIQEAINRNGLAGVLNYYSAVGIKVDFRDFRLVKTEENTALTRIPASGDSTGFTHFNLGSKSLHHGDDNFKKFRVTNYDPAFMQKYQNESDHVYIIANTILDADVIISMPKIKTHRKSGITVTMKNNIGINAHKDCLPHHKKGSTEEGGDEYLHKSISKDFAVMISEFEDSKNSNTIKKLTKTPKRIAYGLARRLSKDLYFEGSWWGNRTLYKTLIDLNNILLFANRQTGQLEDKPLRKFLSIVDGVIAGEAEGPLDPTPKELGILMAGRNPVAVDLTCSRLMGFDWHKIPFLVEAKKCFCTFNAEQIECFSTSEKYQGFILSETQKKFFTFEPSLGWKNHIEI